MTERETRSVELRAADGRKVVGSIPYGAETRIGGFVERLEPRALRPEPDVLALYAHGPRDLLGRTAAGTLRLDNRTDALAFEIDLPDTALGRDVLHLVERGDLRGASFGFEATEEAWQGRSHRTVKAARLFEVSVVPLPAYAGTSLQARSAGLELPLRLRLARRYLDAIA